MSDLTTDRNDPRLGHGADTTPVPQNAAYLVLSEEELAKGYVRPYRDSYLHVGPPGPTFPLRDMTEEEQVRWPGLVEEGYTKFEPYPEGHHGSATGKFWKQSELDRVNAGCQVVTRMSETIARTYAREPRFYGSTYCIQCRMHLPVEEFTWLGTTERVGS